MHSCKLFVFFLGPEWKKKCTSRSSTVQTASPNLPFSLREKCSPSPLIPVLLRCSNYDPCPNCVLTRLLQLHIYFTMSLKSLERIQSSAAFPFFFFFFFLSLSQSLSVTQDQGCCKLTSLKQTLSVCFYIRHHVTIVHF